MIKSAVSKVRSRLGRNSNDTSLAREIRDAYNGIYGDGASSSWHQQLEPEELMKYVIGNRSRVLDIGSGLGENAISWATYEGHSFVVTGIDISDKGVERSRRNARKRGAKVKFVVADFSTYKIRKFDLVTSFFVLNYAGGEEEKEAFVRKMMEHTEPGGKIIIKCYITDPKDGNEVPIYPESRLRELFRSSGWRVLDYREYESTVAVYGDISKPGSVLYSEQQNHSAFIVAQAPELLGAKRG